MYPSYRTNAIASSNQSSAQHSQKIKFIDAEVRSTTTLKGDYDVARKLIMDKTRIYSNEEIAKISGISYTKVSPLRLKLRR